MKYLKIEGDGSIRYPYEIGLLRIENPNTSFPINLNNEILNNFNIRLVIEIQHNEDYTKNYVEGIPSLIDGEYYQNWIETNASQQEIDQRINNQWTVIRYRRNQYLLECDWTQIPDTPLIPEKKEEWVIYRQSLRDITLQPDPFNITWPIKPIN